MKKTVVTILIVLPFLLIYFISVTGQILSQYTHISVERITVIGLTGKELNNNDTIKIGLEDKLDLKIKIYPELSSNKEVIIYNSNDTVCSVDENHIVEGLDLGMSILTISSIDDSSVQFSVRILVTEEELQDLQVINNNIELSVGKTEKINVEFIPSSTIFRDLIWESKNPAVATVDINGTIKGIKSGNTKVIVSSKSNPEISKEIFVTVNSDFSQGVWFDSLNSTYKIYVPTLDLKTIIKIVELDNITISDIKYKLMSGNDVVDNSNINNLDIITDGVLNFKQDLSSTVMTAKIKLYVENTSYSDTITIAYVKN